MNLQLPQIYILARAKEAKTKSELAYDAWYISPSNAPFNVDRPLYLKDIDLLTQNKYLTKVDEKYVRTATGTEALREQIQHLKRAIFTLSTFDV